jgi:HEAT repeat protein
MRATFRNRAAALAAGLALLAAAGCKSKPKAPDVPGLIADLKGEDQEKKGKASLKLIEVPALAEALGDPDLDLRVAAAMALESIGPDAAPAIPALVKALKDKEGIVRQRAVIALGRIGPAADSAIPALVEAGKWDPVRGHVDEAIARIRAR